MEQALAVIDFIEKVLNCENPGVFPYAGHYKPPETFSSFLRKILYSIRGPIVTFFTVALAISIALLVHGIFGVYGRPQDGHRLAVCLGAVMSALLTLTSFRFVWADFRKLEFSAKAT